MPQIHYDPKVTYTFRRAHIDSSNDLVSEMEGLGWVLTGWEILNDDRPEIVMSFFSPSKSKQRKEWEELRAFVEAMRDHHGRGPGRDFAVSACTEILQHMEDEDPHG